MKSIFFSKIDLGDYCLQTDPTNCWFLTKQNEIARLSNIISRGENDVKLCCISTQKKDNFFIIPIESRYLDIYCCHAEAHTFGAAPTKLFDVSEIKCKLVRLKYHKTNVFLPLLHTNESAIGVDDDE